jgi:hypothetical protein
MNKETVDTVYQLARAGLAEVAKTAANGPAVIAMAASRLESFRADCEKLFSPDALQPVPTTPAVPLSDGAAP